MFPAESLSSFLVFAERLNFTAAAKELHISQPALHVKVRKLAEAVGRPLYLRQGRKLVLTADGEAIARFARERQEHLEQFLAELEGRHRDRRVVLSAGQGAYMYLLNDVIARESTRLRLLSGSRSKTIAQLRDGQAQLGVTVLEDLPEGLDTVRLVTFPQMLVVQKDHPLAGRDEVHGADLDGMQMVMPLPGHPSRLMLERMRVAAGIEWEVAVEAGGWPMMVNFVELGVGAAVVNGCVRADLPMIPISDLPPVSYYALYRRGALADLRVARMLDEIRRSLGST